MGFKGKTAEFAAILAAESVDELDDELGDGLRDDLEGALDGELEDDLKLGSDEDSKEIAKKVSRLKNIAASKRDDRAKKAGELAEAIGLPQDVSPYNRDGKRVSTEAKKLICAKVFKIMEGGVPCGKACDKVGVPRSTLMKWVRPEGKLRDQYVQAREHMIHVVAEEILKISDEEPVSIVDHKGITRYDNAAVQHQRLRVDSRKWLLSKMMPKTYGDKSVQEVTGADGGPLTVTALDLKNLTDEELDNMDYLMNKGSSQEGSE